MSLTFVIEDGTGKSDANMYVSVSDTNDYFRRAGEPTAWSGVRAKGQLTLVENPNEDETLVINGVTYTFKSTPTISTQHIELGSTVEATSDNIATTLNLTADEDISASVVSVGLIDIEYAEPGVFGNSIATTETMANSSNVFDAATLGTARAGANPSLNSQEKAIALQRAALYIDTVYGPKFCGYRSVETQALEWPRKDVYTSDGYTIDSDELPPEVIEANQLMALKYAEGTNPIPDLTSPGNVNKEFLKLGPLASLKEYSDGKGEFVRFTQVERLLNRYTRGIGTPMERG